MSITYKQQLGRVKRMRTDLMTPVELEERLSANDEDHLELSIEKHERARLKENWEQLCKNPKKYFYFDACGLCKKYMKDYAPDSYICDGCPLSDGLNIPMTIDLFLRALSSSKLASSIFCSLVSAVVSITYRPTCLSSAPALHH